MKVSAVRKIGTKYKKENIYFASLVPYGTMTKMYWEQMLEESDEEAPVGLIKALMDQEVKSNIITDLFYKDGDKKYIRFTENGPQIFAGDNSDGKGFLQNMVPIWDIYSEDQIVECTINDKFTGIAVVVD